MKALVKIERMIKDVGNSCFRYRDIPTSSKMTPFCLLQNYVSFMKACN